MKILGMWSRKRKEKKKKNITRISRSNRHQSLVPREAKFLLSLDSLTPSFHIDNIDVVRVLTQTRMSCSGNFAPLVGRRKVQYPLDCRRGESIIVYKACKRAKSSLETTQCLTDQFPVFFGLLCDMETVLPLYSSSTAPLRFSFFPFLASSYYYHFSPYLLSFFSGGKYTFSTISYWRSPFSLLRQDLFTAQRIGDFFSFIILIAWREREFTRKQRWGGEAGKRGRGGGWEWDEEEGTGERRGMRIGWGKEGI